MQHMRARLAYRQHAVVAILVVREQALQGRQKLGPASQGAVFGGAKGQQRLSELGQVP